MAVERFIESGGSGKDSFNCSTNEHYVDTSCGRPGIVLTTCRGYREEISPEPSRTQTVTDFPTRLLGGGGLWLLSGTLKDRQMGGEGVPGREGWDPKCRSRKYSEAGEQ